MTVVPAAAGERASPLGLDGRLTVYPHTALPGHAIVGPAVVDGGTFTWLMGAGWRLSVDAFGDALASREDAA